MTTATHTATITSWVGHDDNAAHWYVALRDESTKWDIERILTEADAEALNDHDAFHPMTRFTDWKAGATTNRFDSIADATEAATAVFESVKQEGNTFAVVEIEKGDEWKIPRGHEEVMAYVARCDGGKWVHIADHDPYAGINFTATLIAPPGMLP